MPTPHIIAVQNHRLEGRNDQHWISLDLPRRPTTKERRSQTSVLTSPTNLCTRTMSSVTSATRKTFSLGSSGLWRPCPSTSGRTGSTGCRFGIMANPTVEDEQLAGLNYSTCQSSYFSWFVCKVWNSSWWQVWERIEEVCRKTVLLAHKEMQGAAESSSRLVAQFCRGLLEWNLLLAPVGNYFWAKLCIFLVYWIYFPVHPQVHLQLL